MSRRTVRVNELLRAEISEIIRREARDPRLEVLLSITAVEMSQDMRHARVFVSVLGTTEQRDEALRALKTGRAFYQRLLRQRLPDLRQIPELVFVSDQSIERGQQLTNTLNQLARERAEQ